MEQQYVTDIPTLPARLPDAHKGDFGRVLIVGGCPDMIGAPALAANAALRCGAGLVTIATPESVRQTVASLAWCATSIALPQDPHRGCVSNQAIPILLNAIVIEKRFDVVAVGPGLGQAHAITKLIDELIDAEIPTVIDADALNMLSQTNWHGMLAGNCIITPHSGELARLIGRAVHEIQADRRLSALEAVNMMTAGNLDCNAVCVLKGAGTIVTDGKRMYVNQTGNVGMATGGSGDVLTGAIAGIIGQGLGCFDAAVTAVHVHGCAGDLAADKFGQVSMVADDLLQYLPAAIRQLGTTDPD